MVSTIIALLISLVAGILIVRSLDSQSRKEKEFDAMILQRARFFLQRSRPAVHSSIHPRLPGNDDMSMIPPPGMAGIRKVTQDSIYFAIEYIDLNGQPSTRRISVRSVDGTSFMAYCFERHALRIFKWNRISAVYDPMTGEKIPNLARKISELFDIRRSIERPLYFCRHGFRVLLYLARCEGRIRPAERAMLSNYSSHQMQLSGYVCTADDAAKLTYYASWMMPGPDELSDAIRWLSATGLYSEKRILVARHLRDLFLAGNPPQSDKKFAEGIKAWIEMAGKKSKKPPVPQKAAARLQTARR